MARDERRRQKALARKKAKKEAKKRAARARTGSFQRATEGISKSAIRNAPLHECLCLDALTKIGVGYITITRRLPDGEFASSLFLVDMFCLGVKQALFRIHESLVEYEKFKHLVGEHAPVRAVSAPYARKLVEGAVAYARDLGFEPSRDYRLAAEIFGDINPAECGDAIVFGKDGKPFYMRGPGEDAVRADQIVKHLTRRCGPDGFEFIVTPPDDDDEGEADLFDEDGEVDEEAEMIADEMLDTQPSQPPPEPPPAPAAQEKPKGFFDRLFGR